MDEVERLKKEAAHHLSALDQSQAALAQARAATLQAWLDLEQARAETVKYQQEAAHLRQEVARYQRIVEAANEGIVVADRHYCATYMNRQAAALLGYTMEEANEQVIGHSIFEFLFEEDRSLMLAKIVERQRGEQSNYEFRYRRKDGSPLWCLVSANPLVTPSGEFDGVLGIFTDITDHKHARDEIKQRERQLAEAQEVAHLGSWEWDVSTNTVLWSDELYRIFGLAPQQQEMTYAAYLERVHPDDRERVRQATTIAFETRQPFELEERIVQPDGAIRVLHSRGGVVCDDGGAPLRMRGVCHDITERKQDKELLAQFSRDRQETAHAADKVPAVPSTDA